MKVQVILYLLLLFPGRDEALFHCYSLLNRDCLSIRHVSLRIIIYTIYRIHAPACSVISLFIRIKWICGLDFVAWISFAAWILVL